MYTEAARPRYFQSQQFSAIAAGVLLLGGLSTFFFTTSAAGHQKPAQQSDRTSTAMTYLPKPSPLVPMSREDTRHLNRHAKKAAEAAPADAAVAVLP